MTFLYYYLCPDTCHYNIFVLLFMPWHMSLQHWCTTIHALTCVTRTLLHYYLCPDMCRCTITLHVHWPKIGWNWVIFWSADRCWEFLFLADSQISKNIGRNQVWFWSKFCRKSVETTNQNNVQILASGIYLFIVYGKKPKSSDSSLSNATPSCPLLNWLRDMLIA